MLTSPAPPSPRSIHSVLGVPGCGMILAIMFPDQLRESWGSWLEVLSYLHPRFLKPLLLSKHFSLILDICWGHTFRLGFSWIKWQIWLLDIYGPTTGNDGVFHVVTKASGSCLCVCFAGWLVHSSRAPTHLTMPIQLYSHYNHHHHYALKDWWHKPGHPLASASHSGPLGLLHQVTFIEIISFGKSRK